jgi:hypothetical protein
MFGLPRRRPFTTIGWRISEDLEEIFMAAQKLAPISSNSGQELTEKTQSDQWVEFGD